jgi:hypothetical protein
LCNATDAPAAYFHDSWVEIERQDELEPFMDAGDFLDSSVFAQDDDASKALQSLTRLGSVDSKGTY